MQIFVSYSSKNRTIVRELVKVLQRFDHDVWFDQELRGGEKWWENILQNIRKCDLFIIALTNEWVSSDPCNREFTYAHELERNLLPVKISDVDDIKLIRESIQTLQIIEFDASIVENVLDLHGVLKSIPTTQPLPDPLPPPPPVPILLTATIKEMLSQPIISAENESEILAKIELAFDRPLEQDYIADVLLDFKNHPSVSQNGRHKASELLSKLLDSDSPNMSCDPLIFSSFYPPTIKSGQVSQFVMVAHLAKYPAESLLYRELQKYQSQLDVNLPVPKTNSCMEIDTQISVLVESEDLEFKSPSCTSLWDGELASFVFSFTNAPHNTKSKGSGYVSVQVSGIEVAASKLHIEIDNNSGGIGVSDSKPSPPDSNNPLATARFSREISQTYQKIFVSYSRLDHEIVDAFRNAQQAVGNDVFMDTYSIRTGDNWQVAIARAINEADIFLLFWSEEAAKSEYVRNEWNYALKVRCADNDCIGFIRPIYWQKPIPALPPELQHLNFKYVPLGSSPSIEDS